jgi:lysophospholipase L1-like esterase
MAPRCLAGSSGAFCVTDHLPHNATCTCGFEVCNRTVVPPALAGKKQLLVIGDSISFGWRARVAMNLSVDNWQLTHAGDHPNKGFGGLDNNGNTNWINHCLWSTGNGGGWLTADPERWDMVIINAGLHDLAKDNQHINLTIYSSLLDQIVETLTRQMPSAKLLWLSTTPAPTNPPTPLFPERLQSSVIEYNAAAAAVMSKATVKTCDLFGAVTATCGGQVYSTCPGIQKVGGIHYESGGWDLLARTVAGCVRGLRAPLQSDDDDLATI